MMQSDESILYITIQVINMTLKFGINDQLVMHMHSGFIHDYEITVVSLHFLLIIHYKNFGQLI